MLLNWRYLSPVLGTDSARAGAGSGQGRLTLAHRLRSEGREAAQGFGQGDSDAQEPTTLTVGD